MFEMINRELLTNPESIINVLEVFGFARFKLNNKEIRCAFEEGGNPTAISIRLYNNDELFVRDYRNNLCYGLVTYLVKSKDIPFRIVIQTIQKILGLSDDWAKQKQLPLFGGFYNQIGRKNAEIEVKTYPESVLDQYDMTPNERWIKDGITIEAQRFYNVGYDVESQRIIFPIRSAETGELQGIKGRANFDDYDEYTPKYIYILPTPMSTTLFNYSESYGDLYGNEIWVVESEKSAMISYGFGAKNIVALGSHSLSEKQAQLILQLNPKRVIMALDEGLEFSATEENLKMLKSFSALRDLELWYWDTTLDPTIKGTKCGPCDNGAEYFDKVKNEQLKRWENGKKKVEEI